jgi:hypothetical protein
VELDTLLTKKALANLPWESNSKITEDASDMCKKNCRVKAEALLCCTSPFEVFMVFFQDTLWNSIAQESNRYRLQHEWGQKIDEIKRKEVMNFAGLLIARSLNPWTNGMSNHWRKKGLFVQELLVNISLEKGTRKLLDACILLTTITYLNQRINSTRLHRWYTC